MSMQLRTKFETRTINLRSEIQRNTLLSLVPNLPLDDSRPLQIVIREEVKVRGLDANGYYWLRLGEIAEQAWFNGRQYIADVWHEYFKRHVMPDQVTMKDGETRTKWIEAPDGQLMVVSTTQLERKCFAEYTELVEAFGAGFGVHYSDNPRKKR